MIGAVANHLWQSTAFALAVAALTIAFRHNQARVRYALWLSASLKFFVPFALFLSAGRAFEWAPAAQQLTPPAVSVALVQISEPFEALPAVSGSASAAAPSVDWLGLVLVGIWAGGALTIVAARVRTWRRVRAALDASTPLTLPGAAAGARVDIRSTPGILEPGVVGVMRPVLLVPADIADHLTPAQLAAVLAHEMCHVRRRDNMTAAIHMIVEAIFWFHPLVWWIGARLLDERERACDEEVLRVIDEPKVYAEGILTVCRRYVEAPIACVSGVSGADLRKRIEAIMVNRVGRRLTAPRKTALALAATAAFVAPLAVGMMGAPLRQSTAAPQEYEAASVKPCNDDSVVFSGGRGGATPGGPPAPNRVSIRCAPLQRIIVQAYVTARDLSLDDPASGGLDSRLRGAPDWIRSEQYSIEAVAEGLPERRVLMGTMLRKLLEDRFQLKVHRVTEQAPLYALTVAKGGLKIRPNREGDCLTRDEAPARMGSLEAVAQRASDLRGGAKPVCGNLMMLPGMLAFGGTTFANVAQVLSGRLDRSVLDRTGVSGTFNVLLEFATDDTVRGTPVDAGGGVELPQSAAPSIFGALEQLGLKLESIRGPRQFLVIDRVERPSPN